MIYLTMNKINETFCLLIAISFLLVFPLICHAESVEKELDAKKALLTLQKAMSTVTKIEAEFVQEKNLSLFSKTIKINGFLTIKFPHFFKWEVIKPLKTTITADEENITIWDEETNKTQTTNIASNPVVKNIWTQIDAWFMGRYAELSKSYKITVVKEDPLELIFKPKTKQLSAAVESITIFFREDKAYLNKVILKEVSGDSTVMIFSNIKIKRKNEKNSITKDK